MPGHPLFRVLQAIQERPWAITDRSMVTIMDIVERHMDGREIDLEAVAAKLGQPLDNTGGDVSMRGSIAIIDVTGPIFRYADIFTRISGATAIETLSQNFQTAIESSAVQQIVLNVNSPGGQVDGVSELADMVRAGAAVKPVTAYVDGLAASGAYWIASAANRIVANESSFLGSIGVVVTVMDNRAAQEKRGVKRYEIVSTVSPLKRADVATDEGRSQLLAIADSLAEIFVSRVAAFRGTTAENITQNYGRGGVMIARQAVAAGMADAVSNFESLMNELGNPVTMESLIRPAASAAQELITTMENPTTTTAAATPTVATPAPAPVAAAPPVDQKLRIAAILTCQEANGREQLARTLALETDLDPEAARKILTAAPLAVPAAPAPAPNRLEQAMTQVPNPKVGTSADAGLGDSAEADAASILRFVPKDRRVA